MEHHGRSKCDVMFRLCEDYRHPMLDYLNAIGVLKLCTHTRTLPTCIMFTLRHKYINPMLDPANVIGVSETCSHNHTSDADLLALVWFAGTMEITDCE